MKDPVYELATPGVSRLMPYQPGKPAEELERELGLTGIVKLASNENPLGPSPKGLAAARGVLDTLHLYPDGAGFRLRRKLAQKLGVSAGNITLGSGSNDVLDLVARAFLDAGLNSVFSRHAFAVYPIATQAAGAEARVAEALPADHPEQPYGHDLAALAAAVDERTRVVFIANPNNPTGTWLQRDALHDFIAALPSHLVLVLDEAYTEYVDVADFPNGLDWLGEFPNLIVTRTFSKIYGLAGLRVGYSVSSPAIADLLNRVRHPFNVNSVALAAAEAALDDDDFVARSKAMNLAGMAQLTAGLRELGLSWIPSVGNFLTFDTGRSGAEVYDAMLRKGVILRPIANYGMPGHLRVTVGTEAENARVLSALKQVLEQ